MAKKPEDRPQVTSTAVMSFPQPPLRKAEEYLNAYTTYAFTAISAIAQEVGCIQLKLFQKKFVKGVPQAVQIYEHEVLSLLQYTNPLTTFYDVTEATQVYEELTGEAFWIVLKEGNTPREIWLVRPDWMKIIPDPVEIIKHYTYHPGGDFGDKVIVPKENVIHFKYFNPLNPYRGKGSIQAAALPLDIHTFAQEWNRNFFFNSAVPGLVFTTEKKLSKQVIERFINQWQASYGGRSKSNKIAFLGGGLKMDKTTLGAKELDFTEQQKLMRDDVLAVFKVPKTILGMTDEVNRANAEATTRAFMERVVTPRMRKFVGCLNEFLLPMYAGGENLFFDFVDPSPEDVELKLKKYENARKFTWMTPNEIRIEENLEPIEGGDDLFAPLAGGTSSLFAPTKPKEEKSLKIFGWTFKKEKEPYTPKVKEKPVKHMMPIPVKRIEEIKREKLEKSLTKDIVKLIGQMLKTKNSEEAEKVGISNKPKKGKKDVIFTEEQKDAYWREFIKRAEDSEGELKEKAVDLFKEQEKWILDRLGENVKYWKKSVRKGRESSILPSKEAFARIWLVAFLALLKEKVQEQGDYTLDFLGAGAHLDLSSDTSAEYLREHGVELIKEINDTTREKLRETLAEGFVEEEGIDKLSKRVQEVFKDATRRRADMIARTESIRASNFGSVEAYRQSGVVEAQEWLAERDNRTCEFCMEMDGRVIGLDEVYFEKGDTFKVGGGELKFDLLGVGYPPLHVNCRCTTIPVLVGEK